VTQNRSPRTGPYDRAAGILGDHEAAVFVLREAFLRLQPNRHAERDEGAVDREAAPGVSTTR